MKHLPLSIIVAVICRWIDSCETQAQLATCIQLLDRYVLDRTASEDKSGILVKSLINHLQMRQVALQSLCAEQLHMLQEKYSYAK